MIGSDGLLHLPDPTTRGQRSRCLVERAADPLPGVTYVKCKACPRERKYAALPEWRRPVGAQSWDPAGDAARARDSLADVVLELVSDQTEAQLHADVADEWGVCLFAEVQRAIRSLAADGAIVRGEIGWVRT